MKNSQKDQEQFSLGLFSNNLVDIYKKPVQASQMLIKNGVMTGQQLLAWNFLLKNAKEQKDLESKIEGHKNQSQQAFRISRTLLMEKMGYNSTNRKPFKEAIEKMQRLTASWDVLRHDGDNLWASCVLLPYVAIDNDFVHYSFVEQITPMLFESAIYSKLDLEMQRRLTLDTSIRLYDWVSRYKTNPSLLTNKDDWAFWRLVIHGEIEETSYMKEYKIFKRDKLVPALKEINRVTEINLELLEDKEGTKKIQKLQFKITEKPLFKADSSNEAFEPEKTIDINKILNDLKITNYYRKKIIAAFPQDLILENVEYLKNRLLDSTQEDIKNHGAYLIAACEGNYAEKPLQKVISTTSKHTLSEETTILNEIQKARVNDAIRLFSEFDNETKESHIGKYNGTLSLEEMKIPMSFEKRQNRHMIPFYGWLALETWGKPSPEEIIRFTLNMKYNEK